MDILLSALIVSVPMFLIALELRHMRAVLRESLGSVDRMVDFFTSDAPTDDSDTDWGCDCGHWQEDSCHCDLCGAEPPWGCDCDFCQERNRGYQDDEGCFDEADLP